MSLPDHILEKLQQDYPYFETIASFHADITLEGAFASQWLAAGKKEFAIIRDGMVTMLPREELGQVSTHAFVGGGRLVYDSPEGKQLLVFYSAAKIKEAEGFAQAANQYQDIQRLDSRLQQTMENTEGGVLRRLYSMLPRKKMWRLPVILLALTGGAGAAVVSPALAGRLLFDQVLNPAGKFAGMLLFAVGAILMARIAEVGLRATWGLLNASFIHDLEMSLKQRAFQALQRLSMRFFTGHHTGELMTHLEQDASDVALTFHIIMPSAIHGAVFLAGSLVVMLLLNWQLAVAAIVPFPVLFFVYRRFSPEMNSFYNRMFRAEADLRSVASDSLVGARVVRAFGQ